MKKVIAIFSVLLLGGFLAHFSNATKPAAIEKDSPAFSVALNTAVQTLEGVTSAVTTGARVVEAKGGASQSPTFDPLTCDPQNPDCRYITTQPIYCWVTYEAGLVTCDGQSPTCDAKITCKQWFTCDSRETCDGRATCDGSWTCYNSTCFVAGTQGQTCDGTPTCDRGILCNFTVDGSYTCNGTPQCVQNTLNGWPTCHQKDNPSCASTPADRTTWGDLKARFK